MTFPQPLVFLRHGITAWNREARYQGTTDIALSQEGRTMMRGQGAHIKILIDAGTLDGELISLVASPLQRAQASARELATQLNIDPNSIETENRLRELSMGRWEGLTSQEVKDRFYEERKGRKTKRWTFAPEGGGESMAERAPVIAEAICELRPHSIVVTHSVVIRILLHELGGQSKADAAVAHIPHEGVFLFDGSQLQVFGEDGLSSL